MYLKVLFVVILAVTLAAAACRSDNSNSQPISPEKVQPAGDEAKQSSTEAGESSESSKPGAEVEGQAPAAADPDKDKESGEAKKPTDETKPKKPASANPGAASKE